MIKKILSYLVIIIMAFAAAINYNVFVLPNSFAHSGVNGICTIIMKLTGLNIGYLSLLINIPLAILVYIKVSKTIAIRSMVFVGIFSISLIILEKINFPISYVTENGTSRILGPLAAGVIMGCIYSLLLRAGAYTGGMDFVSVVYNNKHPEKSVFVISFAINTVIAILSFFVYDYQFEPVILCIIYSFASSTMADKALRAGRGAIRFEIVTNNAEEVSKDIINKLHHSATIINSKGAYSGRDTKVLICIVNRSQVAVLNEILSHYTGTFAVMDPVSEVIGNFHKISKNGKRDVEILDEGDRK